MHWAPRQATHISFVREQQEAGEAQDPLQLDAGALSVWGGQCGAPTGPRALLANPMPPPLPPQADQGG